MRTSIEIVTTLLAVGFIIEEARAEGPRRTVQVTARSEVNVPPDEVVVSFAIATEDKDLIKAKIANDERTRAVLGLSARHQLPEGSVRITDLTVSPEFDQDHGKKILISYGFIRSCEVRLHDFTKLEPFLADLLKSGVDVVNSVKFWLRDQRKALGEARELAVRYAKEKAARLAALNDSTLGKALTIYEYEQENEFAMGMGGMASTNRPEGGGIRLADFGLRQTGVNQVTGAARSVQLRTISFPRSSEPRIDPSAQPLEPRPRDLLLAPGQITIKARVTITFELLP